MGKDTEIAWTDSSFNHVIGCAPCSPGCKNCYAKTLTERFGYDFSKRKRTSAANWRQVERWNRDAVLNSVPGYRQMRPRVFCASMADWLDDADVVMPDGRIDRGGIETLADLLDLIRRCPNLDFLMLTKRPENWRRVDLASANLFSRGLQQSGNVVDRWIDDGIPMANVWLGVSAENQEYWDERVPVLMGIPARIHFVSCEPLLGPINQYGPYLKPDWTIWGGESGPRARPCNVDWIRDGVRQCREAGVSAFVKQLGANAVYTAANPSINPRAVEDPRFWVRMHGSTHHPNQLKDRKGGDMAEWPEDLRIRQWPTGGAK